MLEKQQIEEENNRLSAAIDSLTGQQEELAAEIEASAEQIEAMSMDQMQTELLVARKQILLDALVMQQEALEKARMKDSIASSLAQLKVQEQKNQLKMQAAQTNLTFAIAVGALLLTLLAFILYFRSRRFNKLLKNQKQQIESAQQQSEKLLLNILPRPIAEELKQNGSAKAQHYPQASVLFTDFKDFSKIVSQLPPDQLVADLDYCFKAFDKITTKYQLEKIKTIGDAYMCAGGLPTADPEHANHIVAAAMEMQQFLTDWQIERHHQNQPSFEARIGIHTGPIVAGVVGERKFAYDIWGDTVNIASRMESGSMPGRINISQATYELVQEHFACTHRGKLPAKNVGEIDMYFVEGKR
jgi:adenylate cyclase